MYIMGFIRATQDQGSSVDNVEAYWTFIYWLPTSTNFLIYIISTQYRQAYITFLKRLNDFIKNKNSPRRTKVLSSTSRLGFGSSKGDIYLVTGPDGSITPPSNYDILSIEERSNLLSTVCGVITTGTKKICTKSTRCPIHTEAQRREVRIRWLTNDEETHVDIDRYVQNLNSSKRITCNFNIDPAYLIVFIIHHKL